MMQMDEDDMRQFEVRKPERFQVFKKTQSTVEYKEKTYYKYPPTIFNKDMAIWLDFMEHLLQRHST